VLATDSGVIMGANGGALFTPPGYAQRYAFAAAEAEL